MSTRKAKTKTNEQAIIGLIKSLHPIHVALLRERIMVVMEMTIEDIDNNPADWRNGIIHPDAFRQLHEEVKNHLAFDK